ncbi:hypothetical protein D1007_60170 [Hordeum vulgare]|nr:hypothetical protein D1007_60170 [Hordeum vulgare]
MADHFSSVLSGLRVLFQGSSTAGPLASVPEENTAGFTAPYSPPESEGSTTVFKSRHPPGSTYRESIRSVAVSEWHNRSTLSFGSGQSGSNYSSNSGASSSYQSNYSVLSSGTADLGISELTEIAQKMVSDGYLLSVFQSFVDSSSSLENWFVELDVYWVLQPQKSFASWLQLQEMGERWIRALTVIVVSITELVDEIHKEETAVAQFSKAWH